MTAISKMSVIAGLLLAAGFQAQANTAGCTPGFWKNHTAAWAGTGYSPNMLVTAIWPNAGTGTLTLLQALQGGGGSGLEGAKLILLRAGVAALLNEMKFPGQFKTGIVVEMSDYLLAQNREIYLAAASYYDSINNTGCPL